MNYDFLDNQVSKVVLIKESMNRILDKIHQIENTGTMQKLNGMLEAPREYIAFLQGELTRFQKEKDEIEELLKSESIETLREFYVSISASSQEDLGIAKTAYLAELLNKLSMKEGR